MRKELLLPLRRLSGRMREFRAVAWPVIKARVRNPKAVFLVMTPEHGNLGDHAIAQAETQMLAKLDIPYIELTGRKIWYLYHAGWLSVMNGRPILVNGGGNLGTLWFEVEEEIRKLILDNPRSPICILPNTFYYEGTSWGDEELQKSIPVYGKHPNLRLYAREACSYEAMSAIYPNVRLAPDMVLFLEETGVPRQRKGCLLCLRNDCERTRTAQEDAMILRQAAALFGEDVRYTDTCYDCDIPIANRGAALCGKFEEFRGASLVITDRLHGMLFCAITGTPCIVINSKSPKVKGCYDWINHLEYIRFADQISQVEALYRAIPAGEHTYSSLRLVPYYQQLMDDISNMVRRKKG